MTSADRDRLTVTPEDAAEMRSLLVWAQQLLNMSNESGVSQWWDSTQRILDKYPQNDDDRAVRED